MLCYTNNRKCVKIHLWRITYEQCKKECTWRKKSGFDVQAKELRLRSAAILESKTWTVFVY